jgi:hypothetical protein
MLTLFAMMLQTATLDSDTAKAAMTCAQAFTLADAGSKSPIRLTSQFTHLMMHAAKAKPEGQFFDQLKKLSDAMSADTPMPVERAKQFVTPCHARFPLAVSNAPVRLPSDPFRRDLLCFGTLSLLQGAAEEIAKTGTGADLMKIQVALKPLNDKLTDEEIAKRGLAVEDKFLQTLSDEMLASMQIGNPISVAAACGVSLS